MTKASSATGYSPPRREPRTRVAGELSIELAPEGEVICGSLQDASPHGFCITHEHQGFVAGQEIRVLYEWGKVPARVVWVDKRGDQTATGFRTD